MTRFKVRSHVTGILPGWKMRQWVVTETPEAPSYRCRTTFTVFPTWHQAMQHIDKRRNDTMPHVDDPLYGHILWQVLKEKNFTSNA